MFYVLIESTAGYMPDDTDPYVTKDLDHAKQALQESIDSYIEGFIDGSEGMPGLYHVSWADDRESARITFNDPHTLDRCFEIVEEEGYIPDDVDV